MTFRTVKESIETILDAASEGNYRVVGYRNQAISPGEIFRNDRLVRVFFSRGEFPRGVNPGAIGPYKHDVTFHIELAVSESSVADLTVLNSESATDNQRMAALSAYQEGAKLADDSLDELFDYVWNAVMDSRNYDFGLGKGVVSNVSLTSLSKDDPVPRGSYVTLTGTMELSMRVCEYASGEEPEAAGIVDVNIDLYGDAVEKTGVIINLEV